MTTSRPKWVSRAAETALVTAIATLGLGTATAQAAPPGFPDLDAFAPVNAGQYALQQPKASPAIKFATPDGLECGISLYGPDDPTIHTYAWCIGPIPGMPDDAPVVHGPTDKVMSNGAGFVRGGGGTPGPQKVIEVGRKISSANITCVIGADRLTACINRVDNHGFVLQPSGSWTF